MKCPHGINIKHKRCYLCEEIAYAEMKAKQKIIEHDVRILGRRGFTVIRSGRYKGTDKPNKSNPPQ